MPTTLAFGTINSFGQRAEHERITRAALACAPGVQSTGDCFEPRSIDQLAGHAGTFGAVGSPDSDEITNSAAHCDDADFLSTPGYPRTRAQATAELQNCVTHLRGRFGQGVTGAAGLLDAQGELRGPEVDLTDDCTFFGGVAGRAKCNAIEGLGRALHGAQDFYAHSNWTDQADPANPIGTTNPPGLNLTGPSPILDLAGTSSAAIPTDLTTGFFSLPDLCLSINSRVRHGCLNKDKELIDPVSGTATDPQTPRGQVAGNAQRAVTGAIAETRRQWADFRTSLNTAYGAERGGRMARAMTQDVPKVDLVFVIDTTGSMGPFINGTVSVANGVVDTLSGRGASQRLTDFRIALVDYKDVDSDPALGCPPDYDAVVDLQFSTTRTNIIAAINTLPGKVSGGCDIPEDVLSGVNLAVQRPWRDEPGVKKAIIVMGDAPGHDPEPHSGLTSGSVAAAALAVDPAIVYAVLVGRSSSATAFMTQLATRTGGRTFDSNASNVGQAILDAINAIIASPIANAGGPYTGAINSPITFDGSGSSSPAGSIVRWEWDFNNDGIFDASSTAPTSVHTYGAPYTGLVVLRVTDNAVPARTALGTALVNAAGQTLHSVGLPNGSNGFIETPHQTDLNLVGDWTVETWFKDESPLGFNHDYVNLLSKGDREANAESPYFLSLGFKTLVAGVRTGWTDSTVRYDLRTGGLNPANWYHVAASFQASTRTLVLYVDGTERARGVLAATSTGNTLPLQIGRNGPQTGKYFHGHMDDVRIWNSVRSATEIASNFRSELASSAGGLIANWRFDEPNGASAADSAGSHTATLNGGAAFSTDVHP